MKGLNKVEFIGFLGKDPVVTTFENGGKKAEFSLATTDSYKDQQGNWQEKTDWHNCYASGSLANVVEDYFKKGTRVYVEGKLKHRTYTDKEGVKRYVTEVKVKDFMFLTTKKEMEEKPLSESVEKEQDLEDDLPF